MRLLGCHEYVCVTKFLTGTMLSFEKSTKIVRRHDSKETFLRKKHMLYPIYETVSLVHSALFGVLIPCEVYVNMRMQCKLSIANIR